jgi:Peptidase A4 family
MYVMRALRAWSLAALGLVTVASISADAANTATASGRHRPIIIRHIREGAISSTNWSGYAVTGATGSVQDVSGSWTVPSVTCDSGAEYSSFWIGIDGFNSHTVEQIGVDADCQNGSPAYYAWFEFYPHPFVTINKFTVQPGDVVTAEVHYDTKTRQFTVAIHNGAQSFSASTKVNRAERSSAEWITEAPFRAANTLPLAKFSTVSYNSDTAAMNGAPVPIGAFAANNIYEITMVDESGNAKAIPSALGSDKSTFSVQWVSAGP